MAEMKFSEKEKTVVVRTIETFIGAVAIVIAGALVHLWPEMLMASGWGRFLLILSVVVYPTVGTFFMCYPFKK